MRKISIFGSTGSIGVNTLDLIGRRRDEFDIVALSGGRNIDLLARQAREFGAKVVVTAYDECLPALRDALAGTGIQAAAGSAALIEAADRPVDWFMSAIVGAAALEPGYTALRHGTTLALANKESMVAAGPLFLRAAQSSGACLLPVDSEHSAVFQALVGEDISTVECVTITASGGAFRDWPMDRLATATVEQASTHPNWAMGQRITIDSASMFNKGMELIEAKELFGLQSEQIDTVIHPESIIHAMVGYRDGAVMAHMGVPDMRHAIGYALNWPTRAALPVNRLDLVAIGSLTFRAADPVRYPALALAREVMEIGGLSGAVYNAAKEVALDAFIAGRIGFLDMARLVESVLADMTSQDGLGGHEISLDNVLAADARARAVARARVDSGKV